MKTIMFPDDSAEMRSLFEQANNEDLIIRLPDGRQFMLSAIDDFDLEIAKTRQNEKLMAFLEQRARQTDTISLDEVKRRLGMG